MPNVLNVEKQTAIISGLAEGSSIRSLERITGVHRDTIMRLGVRIGKGCAALLDSRMRGLSCRHLQFDELWGFIGKKEKHVRPEDDPTLSDVWTFCAIDSDTKLVPSFKVGKRDAATANTFVADVASRIDTRGKTVWEGVVEVFDLIGHAKASRAYAWTHKAAGKKVRHVTLLHIPPVDSPLAAVRASIVKDFRDSEAEA